MLVVVSASEPAQDEVWEQEVVVVGREACRANAEESSWRTLLEE